MMIFLVGVLFTVFSLHSHSVFANQAEITYALGEERMYSPDGSVFYGNRALLIKRTDSSETIIEVVLSVDPRRGREVYQVTFELSGNNFVCQDIQQTFVCNGKMYGQPGDWTGWTFVAELADNQGSIVVEESFAESGYRGTKKFLNPNGVTQVSMTVEYKKITREMYDLLFDNLKAQNP